MDHRAHVHNSNLPAIFSHGLSDASVGQGKVVSTILVVDQAHDRRQEPVGALQLGRGEVLVSTDDVLDRSVTSESTECDWDRISKIRARQSTRN